MVCSVWAAVCVPSYRGTFPLSLPHSAAISICRTNRRRDSITAHAHWVIGNSYGECPAWKEERPPPSCLTSFRGRPATSCCTSLASGDNEIVFSGAEAFAGEEGSLEPPCDGEDGRVLLRRDGDGRDACRPQSREKNRTRRFRLSGFLAAHPSSDSSFCRAGCSGRRFLRFSRVLPCTRLSTIKSYNIRFPGCRISRNPCKTRANRIL